MTEKYYSKIVFLCYRRLNRWEKSIIMNTVKFNYYEVWYEKRQYQILIPKNYSQFWVHQRLWTGNGFYPEIELSANRKGLEELRNACAVLAGSDNVVVYFPCKQNKIPSAFFEHDEKYYPDACKYLEMVLLKPNTLKISDWKEIRKRISKMKARERIYHFESDFKDMQTPEKYEYCESAAKQSFGYDTVFYNIPRHEYPSIAAWVEKFLERDLEKNFCNSSFDSDCVLFYCGGGLEVDMLFWDEDIYAEVKEKMG